jgi:hypothetical protein
MTSKLFIPFLFIPLATLACSSSETASSRDGGSDSSRGTDAPLIDAGDGAVKDSSTVDAGPLVDELCMISAELICETYQTCEPSQFAFMSLSACEGAWEAICVPEFTATAHYFGVSYVASQLACYQAEAAIGPACAPNPGVTAAEVQAAAKACAAVDSVGPLGTLGKGARCFSPIQCDKDLYCVVPDGGICGGTCEPAASVGEPCTIDLQCDSNLYCDPYAHVCRLAAVGQPCGTATQGEGICGDPPGETFFCYANKCEAWQEKGQACSASKPCDPYNFLYCSTGGTCETATIGAGSACNGSCLGNYYCDPSNQCATPLGSGATCTAGVEKMCDLTQGLVCNGTTCQLGYALPGQPCNGETLCWKSSCVESDAGSATCEAFLEPGASCVNTGGEPQCLLFYECSGGKCVLDSEPADAGIPACDRDAF